MFGFYVSSRLVSHGAHTYVKCCFRPVSVSASKSIRDDFTTTSLPFIVELYRGLGQIALHISSRSVSHLVISFISDVSTNRLLPEIVDDIYRLLCGTTPYLVIRLEFSSCPVEVFDQKNITPRHIPRVTVSVIRLSL